MTDDGVTNLVIGHNLLFIVLKDTALLFKTGDHTFNRFAEILLFDLGSLGTSRKKRRFIDQIGKISTGKTACGLGNAIGSTPSASFTFLA